MRIRPTRLQAVIAAVALVAVVAATALPLLARSRALPDSAVSQASVIPNAVVPATTSAPAPADTQDDAAPPPSAPAAIPDGTARTATPVPAAPATSAPVKAPVAAAVVATAPLTAPVAAAKPAAPAKASVEAYKGLGMWVDIYDDRAWNDPVGAVRDMARHGTKTLYLETANSRQSYAIKDPAKTATFIRTAHANGMRVVAWYLPDMLNVQLDTDRVAAAIKFRTTDGQAFDSFALDIESDKVTPVAKRNAALADLSSRIRKIAGASYPLGAIIPSPLAMSKPDCYWYGFPYEQVARDYDAYVPMSYYTYHGKGGPAALQDTLANVGILRAQKGSADVPIHLIGGIVQDSSPSEVRAFLQAARQTKVYGASLYTWPGVTPQQWVQVDAVRP